MAGIKYTTRGVAEYTSGQPLDSVDRYLMKMNAINSEEMSKLEVTPMGSLAASASKRCRLASDMKGVTFIIKRFEPSERKSFVWESRQLLFFANVPRVQRAVAVCPSTMEIVSCYYGVPSNQFVNGSTPLCDLWMILFQVVETVRGMHDQGMCYNGLRPSNVCVIMTDKGPCVRLLDLELCTPAGCYLPIEKKEGWAKSYPWLAPEVKRGEVCSEASDVYGLGQLMVKLISCKGFFTSGRATTQTLSMWINLSRELNREKRPPLVDALKILYKMRKMSYLIVYKRELSSEESSEDDHLQPQKKRRRSFGKESKILPHVLKRNSPKIACKTQMKIKKSS